MCNKEIIANLKQSKQGFEEILEQGSLSADREVEIRRRIREIERDIDKLNKEQNESIN